MKIAQERTMKTIILGLTTLALLFAAGCGQSFRKDIDVPKTPRYITPPVRQDAALQTRDGSLFVPNSRVAQVNDFRAYDINDLVTIKVIESTTASNSTNVATEKEDTGTLSISNLIGLENRLFPRSVDPSSAYKGDSDMQFESSGTNLRKETVSTTLTARVIDRLPNGNLVIQAVREIIVTHERQVMIVQGIIRPADIDDDNSILSTKIADLQIQYGGSGVLTENMRRGWLTRLVTYVWPF
jgi:flagellar L-ring protein precursor FlgH